MFNKKGKKDILHSRPISNYFQVFQAKQLKHATTSYMYILGFICNICHFTFCIPVLNFILNTSLVLH